MRRLTLMLLGVVLCSGCFRSATVITVKQDGSGVIDQDLGASPQAMALIRSLDSSGDRKSSAGAQMFGPEQAQSVAAAMGVRFVSGEPLKTDQVEGYRAHFAFDDVTKVRLNLHKDELTPGAAAAGAAASDTPSSPVTFGFTKRDDASVLTINIAEQQTPASRLLPQIGGRGASPQENAQAMAMITPMLRGLFVDLSLVVEGRVIKTNAPYINGSRLTLLQFDFDKVNATEGALQKLQQITDPKMLKGIPGVQMVTDPLVTIEFGR
jgi:hypothetical protein